MLIISDLNNIPPLPQPCGLTVGSFDGVHLGHLALLRHLRGKIGPNGTLAVLTFSNHPAEYFGRPVRLICSLEERLKLLKQAGVNLVILLEFNKELASKTYDQFLSEIHQKFPFSYLVLGKGSAFGYQRQGTEENIKKLNYFNSDYIDKTTIDGEVVSSGKIRKYLEEKNMPAASKLLGRPL